MHIFYEREMKAKKHYCCDYCRYRIKQGETYFGICYADSGSVVTSRRHIDCNKICIALNMRCNDYAEWDEDWDIVTFSKIFREIIEEEYLKILKDSVLPVKDFSEIFDIVKKHHFKGKAI